MGPSCWGNDGSSGRSTTGTDGCWKSSTSRSGSYVLVVVAPKRNGRLPPLVVVRLPHGFGL